MLLYKVGWAAQKELLIPTDYFPRTKISIIIPARNEQDNILCCLDSIINQNYPEHLFEVIVVDDHSDDQTPDLVKGYKQKQVTYISLQEHLVNMNSKSFKKAAITTGINYCIGELIITTDADCIAPKDWLRNIAAIYEQKRPTMIIAPVIYTCNNSILEIFQLLDFMSMQGITAAANSNKMGNMCNGANLAFTKLSFQIVDGYKGVDHLATGDDYLLMTKLVQLPDINIVYLKSANAIIKTSPQSTWHSFLQQRIRWSSKSGKYKDSKLTSILILVYLFNFSFLIAIIACKFNSVYFWLLLSMFILKVAIEYLFLIPVAKFFGQMRVLWYFPLLQPLHILYIISAGFLGFIGKYEWKGRMIVGE